MVGFSNIIGKCKSKPQWNITSYSLGLAVFKKNNNVAEDETVTLVYCWQECKMMQLLWKTVGWFLKELNIGASPVAQW